MVDIEIIVWNRRGVDGIGGKREQWKIVWYTKYAIQITDRSLYRSDKCLSRVHTSCHGVCLFGEIIETSSYDILIFVVLNPSLVQGVKRRVVVRLTGEGVLDLLEKILSVTGLSEMTHHVSTMSCYGTFPKRRSLYRDYKC